MVALEHGANTRAREAKKRVPVLDGVRGFCAMSVVITHVAFATIVLGSEAGPPPAGIWSILAAGQVGAIGPFFVMSGFFLYRPFVRMTLAGRPRPRLGQFFLRRSARLVPAFWLVVAFCLLVLNYSNGSGLWYWLRPLVMMHVYDFQWYAGLDVAWTVPTEAQFYLILPLLAGIMHLLARGVDDPRSKARRMFIPLVLLVIVQLAWTLYIYIHYDFWPSQYFYPFVVGGVFALGMAFAIWSVLTDVAPEYEPRFFAVARRRPNWFWVGALAVYAISCAQPFAVAGTADWLKPEAALTRSILLLAFSAFVMIPLVVPGASSRFMTSLLGNGPMRYLGRISYGVYLWHFPVMYLWFRSGSVFGETMPVQMLLGKYGFWELVVPVVLITIAFATVSYFVLERPVTHLAERVVKSRQGPPIDAGDGDGTVTRADPRPTSA